METICKRFPHLAERIFDQVDDQSLDKCKEISEEVLEYLENERFFWIRTIKKYQSKLTLAESKFLCKENAGAILKPLLISNE